MLGAQCTSHRRHNRSQMKNKIYHYGSFSRNFYLSVVKVKVPHPGIKLQMPHTYGRLFKRLCCSFSLMTMGEMLMELFMILLSCLERNLSPPPPPYWWLHLKHKRLVIHTKVKLQSDSLRVIVSCGPANLLTSVFALGTTPRRIQFFISHYIRFIHKCT